MTLIVFFFAVIVEINEMKLNEIVIINPESRRYFHLRE